jgi:hypothetical protein
MTGFVESLARRADTAVSPELALVDPDLAEVERARSSVPSPRSRTRPDLTWSADEFEPNTSAPWEPWVSELRAVAERAVAFGRRRPRLLVSATLCLAVVAIVLHVGLGDGGSGPATEASVPPSPQVVTTPRTPPDHTSKHARRPGGRPSGGTARRFAWAPVGGAESYHVELFRGSERVFSSDSRKASISIPASWTYGGKTRTLAPGEYQWYVWPTVSGKRSSNAVVQAKLDVPSA